MVMLNCNFSLIFFVAMLEEQTGELIPLQKMGFQTISHFLYAMSEYIDIRTVPSQPGQFYVFVSQSK